MYLGWSSHLNRPGGQRFFLVGGSGGVCAAVMALAQGIKSMHKVSDCVEVGYMVGGVWIYNYFGLIGSIFHVISVPV